MHTPTTGSRRAAFVCAAVFTLLAASANSAQAGPPLLCHPFDISDSRSLPWDGSASWFDGDDSYHIARLVADTQSLLTPSTPVVVRMETLRRAAIYASADPRVATDLVSALTARVRDAEARGRADALAYLDAGYAIEALRQIGKLGWSAEFQTRSASMQRVVAELDGYALVKKAIELRPDDPGLSFAAALIAADKNREAYLTHAKAARAGASRDALVARNIQQVR